MSSQEVSRQSHPAFLERQFPQEVDNVNSIESDQAHRDPHPRLNFCLDSERRREVMPVFTEEERGQEQSDRSRYPRRKGSDGIDLKESAFNQFHKSAVNEFAYSALFHGVKFLICFLVLYNRIETCETNEMVKWLEVTKFIEQMTILYNIIVITLYYQKKQAIQVYYINTLITNLDQQTLIEKSTFYFEDHMALLNQHLMLTSTSYRLLHLLFNQISSFLQQLLLVAGNCIYLSFEQTECDLGTQSGVLILLMIGYVFQFAFIAYIFMSVASILIWIPTVICYMTYSLYKHISLKISVKKQTRDRLKKFDSLSKACFDSPECRICLNAYQINDSICSLPCNSKHHFHEKCIQEWLFQQQNCPICRKQV